MGSAEAPKSKGRRCAEGWRRLLRTLLEADHDSTPRERQQVLHGLLHDHHRDDRGMRDRGFGRRPRPRDEDGE
jgi:hypothetical protein